MNANEGMLINAESALDAKGTPVTFTFDKANKAYTIEGADFFSGKQWTVANAFEDMSGYYTISTAEGFLAVSATMGLEQIADGTADAAIWILLEKTYWEDIVNSTYTVAGTKNLTGTENDWDIAEANQMVLNEETGLFEKKFKRIAIDAENQPEFKVVQTNMESETTWYPAGDNWVITTDYVGGEGLYDITITFDPSDFKEIGVIAEKRITFPDNAIVYDFEAASIAGENPANKNGTAANGQGFYGWENPERTDSKRQDYKGYEWAEGSVLPEVCHVWRRSDRINGNVADNGGLKCPSNKEMAVDGLKAGDKVIIVYDAENATDKEIIWAIGDGSSDETLEGPRATATIAGAEAVTGVTTIASGAEILVNSVTPAENGSGYIVFQVKKGMIIQQIAVIPVNAEWAEAIAAAQALAEEDGVAVGKLIEAIDVAKGIAEPNDDQKAALQAAVDQYKLDNADQEKDETAKVATNGWKKFDGSAAGVCATQYAPAITTYDGRTAQMAECYETNGNRTGTIIYQDITGLTNGKYKVGFYGNAFSTSQRDGFECTMEDGATDVAYVFANEEKEITLDRGLAFAQVGNTRDAEAAFRALAKDPSNEYGAQASYELSRMQYEMGNYKSAEQTVNALIDAGTNHHYWLGKSFITLADVYYKQGNVAQAREYLQSLKSSYPGKEKDIFNEIESRLNKWKGGNASSTSNSSTDNGKKNVKSTKSKKN